MNVKICVYTALLLASACYFFTLETTKRSPIVVVGSSAAGTAAIRSFCNAKNCPAVIWVSEQKEQPYNTVKIGSVLKGSKTVEEIEIFDDSELKKLPIIKFGRKVTAINPAKNTIILDNNEKINYTSLFWGTGARVGIPTACSRANLEGVFCFGKLADALAIKKYLKDRAVKHAVVIGFGFNGAELCDILTNKKVQVHVVDRNNRLLHSHTNQEAADFLQRNIEQAGVKFYLNTSVKELVHDGKRVTHVVLTNGKLIPCQLVAFTGINKVNSEIAKAAGIKLHNDSIVVDNYLRTNIKNIFAGGDNILIKDLACNTYRRSCKWSDAEQQGAIAAANMLGDKIPYEGSAIMQHSRFFGYSFVSCGCIANPLSRYKKVFCKDKNYYHLFLYSKGVLKGVLMISKHKLKNLKILKKLIQSGSIIDPEELCKWIK